MKNKMIPDYPIMYKIFYSHMSIREKEQCVCQGLITR